MSTILIRSSQYSSTSLPAAFSIGCKMGAKKKIVAGYPYRSATFFLALKNEEGTFQLLDANHQGKRNGLPDEKKCTQRDSSHRRKWWGRQEKRNQLMVFTGLLHTKGQALLIYDSSPKVNFCQNANIDCDRLWHFLHPSIAYAEEPPRGPQFDDGQYYDFRYDKLFAMTRNR